MTPASKNTKASKKSNLAKASSDELKALDNKWAQRFERLEALLLAKSFCIPVEPVKQICSAIVTTERPFIPPVQCVASPSAIQPTGVVPEPPVKSQSSSGYQSSCHSLYYCHTACCGSRCKNSHPAC